ncbi:MAG TPA: exosome complex RNA-binding protein Rrp4, partial [Candidatus Thermoplasmatota archaeon]|nr:exosome complex RNA-binding protein Rrp4 [Candidatus Thermoplasmatota archaeon]
MPEQRQIVVPGEIVADAAAGLRPGQNTYAEGDSIYALRLGVKTVRGDRVSVIQLSGRYEPARGDMVIGTVVEAGPSNWYINIGAANDVGMHVNDVPWRVEFGETTKYLAIGDSVLLKIVHVDELKKAQVSMKDRQCRKLTGGLILEISPAKVPRVVGRNGSMIGMIKDATNVRLFVGQNGFVWLDGEPEDVQLALEALQKIEAEAHTSGLTDRMRAWLEERRPLAQRPQRAPEETPAEEEPREERPRRERRSPEGARTAERGAFGERRDR